MRDWTWLAAVADHGHITDAAAALSVSQPTLSRALARIETELGTAVFVRIPTGVVPTPAGRQAIDTARALTARYEQLRRQLQNDLDPDSGIVRLAFLDSMATSLVPRLLGEFHRHAPRVRVILRQEPGHEIVAELAAGAVDLAITSNRPDGPYGWHQLQQERLVLVVPPTHRWQHRRRLSLTEVGAEELITTPVGFGHRTLVDGLLRAAGVAPAIAFESQDLATIEGLVAAGLGVAVVPEAFAGRSGTIGIRITGAAARRTIGLTWRSDRILPDPARRLRDLATRARTVVAEPSDSV